MSSEYSSIPSTGALKLKGVKDSKIKKKSKKHSSTTSSITTDNNANTPADKDDSAFTDSSVVLKSLEEEDARMSKEDHRRMGVVNGEQIHAGMGVEGRDPELGEKLKTEAERRHDEARRKRLEDRLKKEGVKTHKQRVEELNKYLSGLSEHHDMPKIGPG